MCLLRSEDGVMREVDKMGRRKMEEEEGDRMRSRGRGILQKKRII